MNERLLFVHLLFAKQAIYAAWVLSVTEIHDSCISFNIF
jgi:hypothetical protein